MCYPFLFRHRKLAKAFNISLIFEFFIVIKLNNKGNTQAMAVG